MIDPHHGWNKSHKPQFIGFVTSLLLTLAVYQIVTLHQVTGSLLTWTIVLFAIFQILLQLFFFLHVGMEAKPQWGLVTFLFTTLVIVIVVGGSIWIMNNINYDLMPMEH
jgi:cytochrome o ubiquinol oxidase operon protein cyoD